jgi:hypothetical protein
MIHPKPNTKIVLFMPHTPESNVEHVTVKRAGEIQQS